MLKLFMKPLTLSIIIPAYNEERHLPDCLDAIAKQTVAPYEVIVVNNNSTDRTLEIAEEYDFVKVVKQKEQGLIASRNYGFDKASGELIARLDADSIIDRNWVKVVLAKFAQRETVAITGPGRTLAVASFIPIYSVIWSRLYFLHMWSYLGFNVLWGPNMVIRKSIWHEIKKQTSKDDNEVHEDQDISILIKSRGYKIDYINSLRITTDGERMAYIPKMLDYELRKRKTYKRHKKMGTLAKARQDALSKPVAWVIGLTLLPFGLVALLLAGFYSIEKLIGIKPIE